MAQWVRGEQVVEVGIELGQLGLQLPAMLGVPGLVELSSQLAIAGQQGGRICGLVLLRKVLWRMHSAHDPPHRHGVDEIHPSPSVALMVPFTVSRLARIRTCTVDPSATRAPARHEWGAGRDTGTNVVTHCPTERWFTP